MKKKRNVEVDRLRQINRERDREREKYRDKIINWKSEYAENLEIV